MKEKRFLISYGDNKSQKKLEEYILKVTGSKHDFGPLGYDGKCTILSTDIELRHFSKVNVTGAIYFPGKKFRGVDEFINWYESQWCSKK